MGLKSMTGFGRGEALARKMRAQVELSSVNRKQLEIKVGLPKSLSVLESKVTKEIGKLFSRGSIVCSVTVLPVATATGTVKVDEAAASALISELRRVAQKLGLKDDLSARSLLELPDVVRLWQTNIRPHEAWPTVRKALAQALVGLAEMRQKEGQGLEIDVRRRLQLMQNRLQQILRLAPMVTKRYRTSLSIRLKRAGVDLAGDKAELFKQFAIFAERSDISEETTRLASHLKQARAAFAKNKPVGRTLDFIAQEMFREINTCGAKANDVRISKHAVIFKTELERLREQIQNVE